MLVTIYHSTLCNIPEDQITVPYDDRSNFTAIRTGKIRPFLTILMDR